MKTAWTLLVAGLLAGCASAPMTDDEAKPVPPERVIDKALLTAQPGTGRVTVKRERNFGGSACAYRVFVNAKPVADLRTGEKVVFFVPAGQHIFGADPGRFCGGSLIEVGGTVSSDKPIAFRIGVGAVSGFYFNATAF